jgi:hypothetical protein
VRARAALIRGAALLPGALVAAFLAWRTLAALALLPALAGALHPHVWRAAWSTPFEERARRALASAPGDADPRVERSVWPVYQLLRETPPDTQVYLLIPRLKLALDPFARLANLLSPRRFQRVFQVQPGWRPEAPLARVVQIPPGPADWQQGLVRLAASEDFALWAAGE